MIFLFSGNRSPRASRLFIFLVISANSRKIKSILISLGLTAIATNISYHILLNSSSLLSIIISNTIINSIILGLSNRSIASVTYS